MCVVGGVNCHLLCGLTNNNIVGTALIPTSTVGMQTLALVSLRYYIHKATSADP